MKPKSNIVLVGMPGAGKSTVGVILAKLLSYGFVDTDLIIQAEHGRSLQDIVDVDGLQRFRQVEEDALLSVDLERHVIATGGSAVYSAAAMAHLGAAGTIVFLALDLASLEQRVDNLASRGLARRPDQSLADLYLEREALYNKYADVTVDCSGLSQEQVCAKIIDAINV